jgi:hypothetical protein
MTIEPIWDPPTAPFNVVRSYLLGVSIDDETSTPMLQNSIMKITITGEQIQVTFGHSAHAEGRDDM